MAKATYVTDGLTGSFSKDNMNNQFHSLYQGDIAVLRPRAQSTPDMTVAVGGGVVESYYQQVWRNGVSPVTYTAGNSPSISAPSTNSRIDLLYLNSSGVLAWVTGTEAASPSAPSLIVPGIPICLVYCKTTMDRILDYEDKDTDATEGYIYRDIRPVLTMPQARTIMWYVDGTLTTGTSQSARIYMDFPATILKARAYADTAPTGAALLFDINKNGSTIWSTQANRLTIAAGAQAGNTATFNTTALSVDDYLTLDIDQAGSTVAGADLTVLLTVRP